MVQGNECLACSNERGWFRQEELGLLEFRMARLPLYLHNWVRDEEGSEQGSEEVERSQEG